MMHNGPITKIRGKMAWALGVQHFLAMFGATVLVPLLTGLDPLVALFTAGIGTLIFHLITGRKVPVFLGSSFAFITPIVLVAQKQGLAYATGGIVVAGAVYLIVALIVMLVGPERIVKLFPPVVSGPVIIVIGLNLAPVAVKMAASNWILAGLTTLTIIVVATFVRSGLKHVPVLIGVAVAYIVALVFGKVDTEPLVKTAWFAIPNFMLPKFSWFAVSVIAPVAIVTMVEHIGDILTNGAVVGKNFLKEPGLHATLAGDGLATLFAGLFGGPANTTYSENTGLLALTRVYDPSVLRKAALIAILVSFWAKIGAVLRTIPQSIIGGVSLVLFGMIASVGIRMLKREEIDFAHPRTLIIVSVILTLGVGGAVLKIGDFELSGMPIAAIAGIILNLILPEGKEMLPMANLKSEVVQE